MNASAALPPTRDTGALGGTNQEEARANNGPYLLWSKAKTHQQARPHSFRASERQRRTASQLNWELVLLREPAGTQPRGGEVGEGLGGGGQQYRPKSIVRKQTAAAQLNFPQKLAGMLLCFCYSFLFPTSLNE